MPARTCPFLGLRHTRNIRFSSPTPEHRCYVSGEAQEVDAGHQEQFCLSSRYEACPLYRRFVGSREEEAAAEGEKAPPSPPPRPRRLTPSEEGRGAWFRRLSPRQRFLYGALVAAILFVLGLYALGFYRLIQRRGGGPTPTPAVAQATPTPAGAAGSLLPTPTPTPVPPTPTPTPLQPTATPTPTPIPPTPTFTPTPTPRPPTPTPTPAAAVPTPTPRPAYVYLRLYFKGEAGPYLIPVTRRLPYTKAVANAALRELIAGPRTAGLTSPLPPGLTYDGLRVEEGVLYVNFNDAFYTYGTNPDLSIQLRWQLDALLLTLGQFPTVSQVSITVDGAPFGSGPWGIPAVNPDNPYGLDPAAARGLIVYLRTPDGRYLVPVTRYVEPTPAVARTAVKEMLKGPSGAYGLAPVWPAGTTLEAIDLVDGVLTVDLSAEALGAADREQAALAVGLTGLQFPTVSRVIVRAGGQELGRFDRYWTWPNLEP